MLTGDKIETAKCIAISTGLKTKREQIFEFVDKEKKDLVDLSEISDAIDRFARQIDDSMLMITGTTLSAIIANPSMTDKFFRVARNAKSVCVCRCSPT